MSILVLQKLGRRSVASLHRGPHGRQVVALLAVIVAFAGFLRLHVLHNKLTRKGGRVEGHQVPTAGGVIGVQLAAKDNSRSDTVRITSGAELDEELELQDIQDYDESRDDEDRSTDEDSNGNSHAAHFVGRARSGGHGVGNHRSSQHGSKAAGNRPPPSVLSHLLGSAKGNILSALRVTSGSDPKAAKKEALEDARSITRERQSLAHATGKMPQGLIVELSSLRGDKNEIVIETGTAWPNQGQPADRACSRRGVLSGASCLCPAMFASKDCTDPSKFEKARTMVSWTAPYQGNLMCARNTIAKGQPLKVARNPTGSSKQDFLATTIAKAGSAFLPTLPSNDPLSGQLLRTCAVVGSSSILLHGPPRGKAIDGHSAIFRLNNAPTRGYERFVGKRTTFRLTSEEAHVFGWREEVAEIGIQMVRSERDLRAFMVLKRRLRGLRLTILHTDFINFMDASFNFMPSIGLYAIVMAILRCSHVTIFGFQSSPVMMKDFIGGRYRYFQNSGRASDPTRDEEEWQVLASLEAGGILSFGDPCIKECHQKLQVPCRTCLGRYYSKSPL